MDDDAPYIESGEKPQQTQALATEYDKYYQQHLKTDGPHIALLLRSGNWWNVYGLCVDGEITTNVLELKDILGVGICGEKNKNIIKIGIRIDMLEDKAPVLQRYGYTIIIYEQYDDAKGEKVRRYLSTTPPGVPFGDGDLDSTTEFNRTCVYISNAHPKKAPPQSRVLMSRVDVSIGMSSVDVSTGIVGLHESQSAENYDAQSYDECYRFIQTTKPVKICFAYRGFNSWTDEQREDFHQAVCTKIGVDASVGIATPVKVSTRWSDELTITAEQPHFQEASLAKVYKTTSPSVLQNLITLKPFAITALYIDMDELKRSNPNILSKLRLPEVWQNNKSLVLAHNAIRQLDLVRGQSDTVECHCSASRCISKSKGQGRQAEYLSDIIDNTSTNAGKRKLIRWINCPSSNPSEIQARLDIVSKLVALTPGKREAIRKLFRAVKKDVAKVARMTKLTPKNLGELCGSLETMLDIFTEMKTIGINDTPPEEELNIIRNFIEVVANTFDVDVLNVSDLSNDINSLRIFNQGISADVDRAFEEINQANVSVGTIAKQFSDLMYPTLHGAKLEEKTKDMIQQKPGSLGYRFTKMFEPQVRYYLHAISTYPSERLKSIRWFQTPKEFEDSQEAKELSLIVSASSATESVAEAAAKKKKASKKKVKAVVAESPSADVNSDEEPGTPNSNFASQLKHFNGAKTAPAKTPKQKVLSAEIRRLLTGAVIMKQSSAFVIQFPNASKAQEVIDNAAEKALKMVSEAFATFVSKHLNPLINTLDNVNDRVSRLDVLLSNAITSCKNHYKKPTVITGGPNQDSFIRAKGMRHPIIEQQLRGVKYISNDLSIGEYKVMDSDKTTGLLLYGVNNIGKTSFEKATVLNVVLAQIGCFVAAESFVFCPFDNIITRLSGHDDMSRGQGTFVVEMTELRTITTQSTKRTLAIGDEVCHGTEFESGMSIVEATIKDLASKNVKFLFATHLHALSSRPAVVALKNVRSVHFHVEEMPGPSGRMELIYDRRLRDGSGLDTYGIEVAKAQGIPLHIVEDAFAIRNELKGQSKNLVNMKTSSYNKRVVVDKCWINGCDVNSGSGPYTNIDTHHIRFQSEADENGVIDDLFDKDTEFNLVTLCKQHHQDVHKGKIVIDCWGSTVKGERILIYRNVESGNVELPDSPGLSRKVAPTDTSKGKPVQLPPKKAVVKKSEPMQTSMNAFAQKIIRKG